MDSKKSSDLSLLEQDIWFNFCYFYQCDLDDVNRTGFVGDQLS